MKEEACINNLLREIEALDKKEGDGVLSPDEVARRKSFRMDAANRLHMEEISWRQKVREKWLKEWDINTRYFHCLTSHRKICNYVEEMVIDNKNIKGNENMWVKAQEFFQCLYEEEKGIKPKLDGLHFKYQIQPEESSLKKKYA